MDQLQVSHHATKDQVETLKQSVDHYTKQEKDFLFEIAMRDEQLQLRDEKITELDADYRIIKESSDVKISALAQQIKYQEVRVFLHTYTHTHTHTHTHTYIYKCV